MGVIAVGRDAQWKVWLKMSVARENWDRSLSKGIPRLSNIHIKSGFWKALSGLALEKRMRVAQVHIAREEWDWSLSLGVPRLSKPSCWLEWMSVNNNVDEQLFWLWENSHMTYKTEKYQWSSSYQLFNIISRSACSWVTRGMYKCSSTVLPQCSIVSACSWVSLGMYSSFPLALVFAWEAWT